MFAGILAWLHTVWTNVAFLYECFIVSSSKIFKSFFWEDFFTQDLIKMNSFLGLFQGKLTFIWEFTEAIFILYFTPNFSDR